MKAFLAAFLASCSMAAHAGQFNVLVFSKTAGWRHESILAGVAAVQEMGKLHDFGVVWTEDAGRVFTDQELPKYQAVVFLLTTGDVLDERQQATFERFIKAGGGYVGVHSAADTEHGWPWYTRLVGRMFVSHPAIQSAVLTVEERNFPGMDRYARRSLATEEWYDFGPARSDLTYLMTVDGSTYKSATAGSFHPVSWYQQVDGGRSFYTALGHLPATYGDPLFRHHLYGGIYWAATGRSFKAD